jgi:galactokinase
MDKNYEAVRISNDPEQGLIEINWVNYFLCGYKSVMLHNEEFRSYLTGPPKGLKILIDSKVPIAAGLSSSSAFTVCTSIMASHANGIREKINR